MKVFFHAPEETIVNLLAAFDRLLTTPFERHCQP
jgi:hypothetical protein